RAGGVVGDERDAPTRGRWTRRGLTPTLSPHCGRANRRRGAVIPMPANLHSADAPLDLKPGEWVEVRGLTEILATLDEQGRLSALSFMPEMERFCGRRFRVSRRADKACDRVRKSGNR